MSRLKDIDRESLPAEHQEIWDEIAAGRGGMHGPYLALMRSPLLAQKVAHVGDYFRHQGLLQASDRELAILSAARELGSMYEWQRHEASALNAGVRQEAIDSLRNMTFDKLNDRELIVLEVVQSLFRTKTIPARLFEKAKAQLGEGALVELVALAGFYCAIGFVLLGFEVPLPDGVGPTF